MKENDKMDDATFRYKNEVVGTVQLQIMDKSMSKDITLEERNDIMQQMLENDCEFLLLGSTFVNKKTILFMEFLQKQQEVTQ